MKTITAGGKEYELYCTTGKVAETGKNIETRISGGGGGGATFGGYGATAPVNIQSQTIVHDQVFLVDDKGMEHSYQLQGFNLACRSSNILSIIQSVKKGDKKGYYIAALNHTTGQAFYNKAALNSMFRRPVWMLLAGILACIILGSTFSILYLGIFVLPILWAVEGSMGASKFKNSLNIEEYNEYRLPPSSAIAL